MGTSGRVRSLTTAAVGCSKTLISQSYRHRPGIFVLLSVNLRSFVREQMEKCKKFCIHRSVDAAPAQLIVIGPHRGSPVRGVPMSGREKPVTRLTELSLARRGRLRRAGELPRKRFLQRRGQLNGERLHPDQRLADGAPACQDGRHRQAHAANPRHAALREDRVTLDEVVKINIAPSDAPSPVCPHSRGRASAISPQ